jgi:hypothetical protein
MLPSYCSISLNVNLTAIALLGYQDQFVIREQDLLVIIIPIIDVVVIIEQSYANHFYSFSPMMLCGKNNL